MAKAPAKVDANGKEIEEYPKILYPSKTIVNNEKEEADFLAKENPEGEKPKKEGKPAGWDK